MVLRLTGVSGMWAEGQSTPCAGRSSRSHEHNASLNERTTRSSGAPAALLPSFGVALLGTDGVALLGTDGIALLHACLGEIHVSFSPSLGPRIDCNQADSDQRREASQQDSGISNWHHHSPSVRSYRSTASRAVGTVRTLATPAACVLDWRELRVCPTRSRQVVLPRASASSLSQGNTLLFRCGTLRVACWTL